MGSPAASRVNFSARMTFPMIGKPAFIVSNDWKMRSIAKEVCVHPANVHSLSCVLIIVVLAEYDGLILALWFLKSKKQLKSGCIF